MKGKKKRGPRWGAFEKATFPPAIEAARREMLGQAFADSEVFLNDVYQVEVQWFDSDALKVKGMRWLSIKRRDRKPIHDWRELQAIKNALCGPECEAVELYPSEARLIDTANQYHLFVLPRGMAWPFGYFYREVSEVSSQGSVQRPFAPHVLPPDLLTPTQVAERECRPLPSDAPATCDWGECNAPAVALRFSTKHGWLPVCATCKTK